MPHDDLTLALELAADAAAIAMSWWGPDVPATSKDDGSPVTEADLEVNAALVDALAEARPDDGVLSEEMAETIGSSGRRWIIDPIDGTRAFMSGSTGWGTHIALDEDGEITLGVITRPNEDRLYWAISGHGAFSAALSAPDVRLEKLQLSATADLGAAHLSGYGSPKDPDLIMLGERTNFDRRTISPIGDFLNGRLDALLMVGGAVWDFAPLVPLTREAGGDVQSRDGSAALDQQWLLCSNGPLREPLAKLWP